MFEDEVEEPEVLMPRRWRWTAALGVGVNFVANVGRAVSACGDDLATLLAQHTATSYERDDMVSSVRADLESLPAIDGKEEGQGL